MRQRAHRPAPPYRAGDSVINGKPAYEAGAVPDDLLTLKQLEKLKRRYGPGQEPAAWLRYSLGGAPSTSSPSRDGSARPLAVAPLYSITETVPKRLCSPSQLAVLEAARGLRRVCDYCGRVAERNLKPGEPCSNCFRVSLTVTLLALPDRMITWPRARSIQCGEASPAFLAFITDENPHLTEPDER